MTSPDIYLPVIAFYVVQGGLFIYETKLLFKTHFLK